MTWVFPRTVKSKRSGLPVKRKAVNNAQRQGAHRLLAIELRTGSPPHYRGRLGLSRRRRATHNPDMVLGMLVVEWIARIRREFFVKGKSIKEVVRNLGVSRNTVCEVLRSGETAFSYEQSA